MTMTTSKISHIIFDLDGLLLDTERIYTQVSTELLKQHGKEYSFELKAKLMGKAPKEVAAAFIKHYELEGKVTEEEWIKNTKENAEGLLAKCQLMPGAANLVYHFYKVK